MVDLTIINDALEKTLMEDSVNVVWLDAPTRILTGIYDSRHFEIEGGGEIMTSELITTLAVKDDPLDPPEVGEKVVVRETAYRIKDRRPDKEGWAVLELERTVL